MLRVISLGAGVQSTTMALMAAHGELTPLPDCAIFADTGWEPQAVYDHLDWLTGQLPFPVHRVMAGDLKADVIASEVSGKSGGKSSFVAAPFYSPTGMGRRECTRHYKIEPIQQLIRTLLGVAKGCKVPKTRTAEVWVGISLDEAYRMKPSQKAWEQRRWPLIEMRKNRNDCLQWMKRNGYPQPPRSACLGCPLKSDADWRNTKNGNPAEWAETVAIDLAIRANSRQPQFMHRSLKSLDQVDFSTVEDHGQLNLFLNECEGMCGV